MPFFALVLACFGRPTEPPTVVSVPEAPPGPDQLRVRIEQVAASARVRICERPVLFASAVQGPADADLLAVVAAPPEVELGGLVRRAVAHTDACSPFLPGRHPYTSDSSFAPLYALKKRISELAEVGATPPETFAAVLEGIQFGQDLGRGGPPMLQASIGASLASDLAPLGHELLRQDGWTPAELDLSARALDSLLTADWVHPAEAFEAEILVAASTALSSIGEQVPFAIPVPDEAALSLTGDAKRDTDLALRGLGKRWAEWSKACPVGGHRLACVQGIEDFYDVDAWHRAETALANLGTPPPWDVPLGDPLESVLEDYVSLPATTLARSPAAMLVEAHSRVAALRLHVEQLRTGACPAAVDGPEEWVVVRPAKGGVELWAPEPLRATYQPKPMATLWCERSAE